MTSQATCAVPLLALTLFALCACEQRSGPAGNAAAAGAALFVEIDPPGLDFRHGAGRGSDYHSPEIMGSGGALFDYDRDGDLDLYLLDAGGVDTRNRMYRQEIDGSFTDVTGPSGLGDTGYGMGAALGDVDNDGDLDLLVTNHGPDALYLDQGDGTFRRARTAIGDDGWSTSACFFDYDADGLLDLYVATYLDFDPPRACTDNAGNPEFCGPQVFRGLPDRLYRNEGASPGGEVGFRDVSATALARRPRNKGLGVACADFNGDSRPDVYVANDGEPNQLWIHRADPAGAGFEDRAVVLGAAVNAFSQPEASMGIAAGDVDGDLDLDLFMTHLDRETNTIYINLGERGFDDRTSLSGLGPAGLAHTGFGTLLLDADLDADLDLAVVNGRVRRGASPTQRAARRQRVDPAVPPLLIDYAEPNLFFANDGAGRFSDLGVRAGALTATMEVSRGLLSGDLDADGDLDLVVTNTGGPARIYRNEAASAGHWLAVRAIDPALGRDALGALVTIRAGGRSQIRPIVSAVSYLSAVEPEAHFGLAAAARFDGASVIWPDGTREEFEGGAADRRVILAKGEGKRP